MKKLYTTLVAVLALTQFSYAQWSTGTGTIFPTTITDKVGIGTIPYTPLHVIKTSEQFRLGFDVNNYVSFTTNSTGRLTIVSTGGSVNTTSRFGVGMMAGGSTNLSVNRDLTGSATSYGALVSGEIQSDVTTAVVYGTSISTQPTAFTLGNLIHYRTAQSSIGAGSTVLNQFGFYALGLTGANNNYGFWGGLAASTGRWNLYMNGSAPNYLAGNLGIGTNNPSAPLDVRSSANSSWSAQITNNGTTDAHGLYVNIGSGSTGIPFRVDVNGSNKLQVSNDGNVGIGTTTTNAGFKLSVNGKIRSTEIKVETGWADYVFDKEYQLRPITEVEAFIKKNHHLPEVPTTAEVEKNGVNLGETSSLLLKKIEELTLYLIEKDKQITEIQNELKALKQQSNNIIKP
jgi:hypothetical protein